MSYPRSPYIEDHREDGIATECWLCGGYIHAGTYPDICKECKPEFELECLINQTYRSLARQIPGENKLDTPTLF